MLIYTWKKLSVINFDIDILPLTHLFFLKKDINLGWLTI